MYQPPICKNDRCTNLVPAGKNPGAKRLFCSNRCARRFHARMSYAREQARDGNTKVFVNEFGRAQVNRVLPRTSAAAKARWKAHMNHCIIHNGPCPASGDPYGKRQLCLIAATFIDDFYHLEEVEKGRPIRRSSTTIDGQWLVDFPESEREALSKPSKEPLTLTEQERQELFDAGVGKKRESDWISAEDLRRYNEE